MFQEFFLTWIIFKVFIEFVTILPPFCVLVFWPVMHVGSFAPQPGIKPTPPALEGKASTTGPPGKSPGYTLKCPLSPRGASWGFQRAHTHCGGHLRGLDAARPSLPDSWLLHGLFPLALAIHQYSSSGFNCKPAHGSTSGQQHSHTFDISANMATSFYSEATG